MPTVHQIVEVALHEALHLAERVSVGRIGYEDGGIEIQSDTIVHTLVAVNGRMLLFIVLEEFLLLNLVLLGKDPIKHFLGVPSPPLLIGQNWAFYVGTLRHWGAVAPS